MRKTIARDNADFTPSPLNIATTLLYDQCAGQHVPSGELLQREGYGFHVCARCGVPFGKRYLFNMGWQDVA